VDNKEKYEPISDLSPTSVQTARGGRRQVTYARNLIHIWDVDNEGKYEPISDLSPTSVQTARGGRRQVTYERNLIHI